MNKDFFRLDRDISLSGCWRIDDLFDQTGKKLDGRDFTYGRRIDIGNFGVKAQLWDSDEVIEAALPLRFSLYSGGHSLSFSFTTSYLPVATSSVANLLSSIAPVDIQRIPVKVESREGEDYEIINIISVVSCIDREKSILDWRTEADGRPDLVGRAKTIKKLVVDPDRIGNVHIFLLGERTTDIIVSGTVKAAFEAANVTGVAFTLVS